MEGWRQWRLGGRKTLSNGKQKRILLTPTGLLMESVIATLRLLFARQPKGKRKLVRNLEVRLLGRRPARDRLRQYRMERGLRERN